MIEASPNSSGIRSSQTLYGVIPSESPPGHLTITANASPGYKLNQPWKLGFDFEMGRDRVELGKKYGACMMFSQEKPPEEAKSGQGEDTLEAVLLEDGKLEVDATFDLGEEKARPLKYGDVCMKRLTAVRF